MGNTIKHPLCAAELSEFFSAFQELEKLPQKQPLLRLQAFFEEFKRLELRIHSQKDLQPQPVNQLPASQYHDFYQSFARLHQVEKQRGVEINVWQQAGLKRDEVRNTAVLAWWLDCYGSHALGNQLLKTMLSTLPISEKLPTLDEIEDYWVRVESLPLGETENRIDIEIKGKNFLIFIEVKINAREGDKQLERYYNLLHEKADLYGLEKRVLIYLTRNSAPRITIDDCICLSWNNLTLAIGKIKLPAQALFSQRLLHQFCQHIQSF